LANAKQWLDILTILFSCIVQKNTIKKSQINIPTIYASKDKVNFNVANASTNL